MLDKTFRGLNSEVLVQQCNAVSVMGSMRKEDIPNGTVQVRLDITVLKKLPGSCESWKGIVRVCCVETVFPSFGRIEARYEGPVCFSVITLS